MNKNSIPEDTNMMVPGGLRIGSPMVTSRGFLEKDSEHAMEFLDESVELALAL